MILQNLKLIYEDLRAGKDMLKDADLVKYFREVLLLREKRKLK